LQEVVCLSFEGITVNVLHPGSVRTNLYSNITQPLGFIFLYILSPLLFRVRLLVFFVLPYFYFVKRTGTATLAVQMIVNLSLCHIMSVFRFACGPADATAAHCLFLQYIQIGFAFLVLPLWYQLT